MQLRYLVSLRIGSHSVSASPVQPWSLASVGRILVVRAHASFQKSVRCPREQVTWLTLYFSMDWQLAQGLL